MFEVRDGDETFIQRREFSTGFRRDLKRDKRSIEKQILIFLFEGFHIIHKEEEIDIGVQLEVLLSD